MKNVKKISALLSVLFVLTGMMSCDLSGNIKNVLPQVSGNWDAGSGTTMEITSESFKSYNNEVLAYSAKVESFDNTCWNSSEKGEGDYGYLLIKIETAPAANPGIKDKYTVVRWENLKLENGTTTMEYCVEIEDAASCFDKADDALGSVTDEKGFFKTFTNVTKIKE